MTEADYFLRLREIYNNRNPHGLIGEDNLEEEEDEWPFTVRHLSLLGSTCTRSYPKYVYYSAISA